MSARGVAQGDGTHDASRRQSPQVSVLVMRLLRCVRSFSQSLGALVLALVAPFAGCPREILVLDHVADLALHRDRKQHEKIHNEYGPEDGDVEEREECKHRRHNDRLGCSVPKLELWEPANERAKLLVGLSRERRAVLLFVVVIVHRRINARRQKGNEQIQQIYAQSISHNVPALDKVHTQRVEKRKHSSEGPSCGHVGRRVIQQLLVSLLQRHNKPVERRRSRCRGACGGGRSTECVHVLTASQSPSWTPRRTTHNGALCLVTPPNNNAPASFLEQQTMIRNVAQTNLLRTNDPACFRHVMVLFRRYILSQFP
eukprot:Opistho-2@44149